MRNGQKRRSKNRACSLLLPHSNRWDKQWQELYARMHTQYTYRQTASMPERCRQKKIASRGYILLSIGYARCSCAVSGGAARTTVSGCDEWQPSTGRYLAGDCCWPCVGFFYFFGTRTHNTYSTIRWWSTGSHAHCTHIHTPDTQWRWCNELCYHGTTPWYLYFKFAHWNTLDIMQFFCVCIVPSVFTHCCADVLFVVLVVFSCFFSHIA